MRTRAKTAAAAIGLAALAVVGMDAGTYAGTGDSLILGKLNKSNKTTHVTNTGKGPALSLYAKGKRPALAVDSKAKIARLNADRVDGREAASLQNNVRVFTVRTGNSDGDIAWVLPSVPRGRYQATYSVYMNGASGSLQNPTIARCALHDRDGSATSGYSSTVSVGGEDPTLSNSDVIQIQDTPWEFYCRSYSYSAASVGWSISPTIPIRITLTRIDKTIGGTLTSGAIRTTPHSPLSLRP